MKAEDHDAATAIHFKSAFDALTALEAGGKLSKADAIMAAGMLESLCRMDGGGPDAVCGAHSHGGRFVLFGVRLFATCPICGQR